MPLLASQPLVVRALIGLGCLITLATAFSIPGGADPNDDNFIDALSHAGIEYGEPGNAMAVGQSVCPTLTQPGASFAAVATGVARRGMTPQAARMFTTIAIRTYCPEQMANLLGGNGSPANGVNGVTGVPGV